VVDWVDDALLAAESTGTTVEGVFFEFIVLNGLLAVVALNNETL